MAKRTANTLSVPDLERMLAAARKEAEDLQRERAGIEERMAAIDARLAELNGTGLRRGPGRLPKAGGVEAGRGPAIAAKPTRKGKKPGRKKMTMPEHVAKIIEAAKNPISPAQISDMLKKKGVSQAKTLATQVIQILKGDQVRARKVGRGQYVAAEKR